MNLGRVIRDKNKTKKYPRVINFSHKLLQIINIVNFKLRWVKVTRSIKKFILIAVLIMIKFTVFSSKHVPAVGGRSPKVFVTNLI